MSYDGRPRPRTQDPILNKSVFGRKEDDEENFRKYTKVAISGTYYMACIKTCFANYDEPLSSGEKICLAKCLDRAYDFFALTSDQINPYKKAI